MRKVLIPKKDYVKELIKIIRVTKDEQKLRNLLSDYHEKDIAEAITFLTETERKHLYHVLGSERIAEIFSYFDDAEMYLEELSLEQAAKVVSYMDADDALDVLDDLSESKKNAIVSHLDADAQKDVQKLLSYEEDEIGSCMTNNFVCISEKLSVREAMSELVRQAGEHDNISTIYVTDEEEKFAGAIDLKDLIIARENTPLQEIISSSYPYVYEHEKISECVEKIADYEEDSIPVLTQDGKIAGILTATDIVELVDDAMGDDYAKLAGLTSEEDLKEPTIVSMKKRLPWLIILLFLGMAVSSVVGIFESVVAVLPIVICFQSLVLDMAGNAVACSNDPCTCGRGFGYQKKTGSSRKRNEDRLFKRSESWRYGTCISWHLHPPVQKICLDVSIPDLRMCWDFSGRCDGNLWFCRYDHPDVLPQDPY